VRGFSFCFLVARKTGRAALMVSALFSRLAW
jgi:hypothetical protein